MRVSAWLYLFQQMLTSACLLAAIGLGAGCPPRFPWRALLLSLPVALLTMAGQMLSPWLRLLMLPAAALAPLAAWPEAPRRMKARMAALGLAIPLALTGLMRLMTSLHLPWPVTLPASCAALLLVARPGGRAVPLPPCTRVEVTLHRRAATLTALVDTGNLLRDSVTGLPVIVISRPAARRLMRLPPGDTLLPGMRLMPVRTVSGVALMTILRPESVRIRTGDAWQDVSAVIGLSPGGGEGFQALVPACLLSGAPACRPGESPAQSITKGG